MSRINPLHLLALLSVAILFLFFQLSGVKQELHTEKANLQESRELAIRLESFKKQHGNAKRVKSAVQRILLQPFLQNAKVSVSYNSNAVIIMAKSLSLQTLNALMTKILNGAYSIKSLAIHRVDTHHARMRLEITW